MSYEKLNLKNGTKFTAEHLEHIEDGIADNSSATDVLSARMDSFTTMAEGSTTGDAELIDGRTDYTGRTWGNIGEHVRGITGQLSEEIDGIAKKIPSINLFDNNFDQSGYIDPSTGRDESASGYKRTSAYYPITPNGADVLYVLLSEPVNPFVVVIYNADKNRLAYGSASNVTSGTITLPSGAAYFRVYTGGAYAADCCISTVYTPVMVDNAPNFELSAQLAPDAVAMDNLGGDIADKQNMSTSIKSGIYLDPATGAETTFASYRASADFIPVTPGEQYVFGVFNASGAPSVEVKSMQVIFYDNSKLLVSSAYVSGYTHDNSEWYQGMMAFTAPDAAAYCKLCVNDADAPLYWWFSPKQDSIIYRQHKAIKPENLYYNNKLQGKKIAVFGDSIMGNTRDYTSTPAQISLYSGATVYNYGFGGCRMSVHAAGWDNCSMYRIADCIYNDNFSPIVSAVDAGWSGMPGYYKNTVAWLEAQDFSDVDAIIIAYGTNDYREETSVLDNADDPFDTSTVCGALRYSIKQILRKYPGVKILVTSPIFRTFFADGTTMPEEYSDTKDWGSGTLLDYAEAYEKACKYMKVPYLNLYDVCQFSEYTRLHFYPSDDGTHPNELGRQRIAELIAGKLMTIMAGN